jgi:hypothetical protein
VPRHPRFYSLRNNRFQARIQGLAGSASLSLVELIGNLILELLSAPYFAAFAASFASISVHNRQHSGMSGNFCQFSDQFSDNHSAYKYFLVAAA